MRQTRGLKQNKSSACGRLHRKISKEIPNKEKKRSRKVINSKLHPRVPRECQCGLPQAQCSTALLVRLRLSPPERAVRVRANLENKVSVIDPTRVKSRMVNQEGILEEDRGIQTPKFLLVG